MIRQVVSGIEHAIPDRCTLHRHVACRHEKPDAPEILHSDGSAERDFPLDIPSGESVTSGTILIASVTFISMG